MKTLIFCTAYAADLMTWDHKHRMWVNGIRSSGLHHSHLLLPDDGSPDIPEWFDAEHTWEPELPALTTDITIYRFRENLGRSGIFTQPGWYRSFVFAAVFARYHGFDRLIHIEADSAIISQRMVDYLNQFEQGWEAFWCPRWNLPETAVQVLAGDAIQKLFDFAHIPYWDNFAGRQVDPPVHSGQTSYFPFTINRDFIGDRYGEYTKEIPRDADYACQVDLDIPRWWI